MTSHNDKDLEKKVREIIARHFRLSIESVTATASIFRLAKDSLAIVELVLALEHEFGVKIEDEDLEKIGVVADLTNYIRQKIFSRPTPLPEEFPRTSE